MLVEVVEHRPGERPGSVGHDRLRRPGPGGTGRNEGALRGGGRGRPAPRPKVDHDVEAGAVVDDRQQRARGPGH
eukprot:10371480-Alexandrium_andersonii.AAC.1